MYGSLTQHQAAAQRRLNASRPVFAAVHAAAGRLGMKDTAHRLGVSQDCVGRVCAAYSANEAAKVSLREVAEGRGDMGEFRVQEDAADRAFGAVRTGEVHQLEHNAAHLDEPAPAPPPAPTKAKTPERGALPGFRHTDHDHPEKR